MQNNKGKAKSQNLQRKASKKSKARKPRTSKKGSPGMTGLAPRATNPARPFKVTSGRRLDGSSCRIKGTDFLTAVTIGATAAAAGDVLISQIVNPAQLGLARLMTMAKLYERYKFRSLKFRYSPVANATVSGQIIGYVDYDTYDDPTGISGVQNLQRAAAHYGEKPVQIWQGSERPVFWEIKDVDPMTDLYVDSDGTDPRWTNQGRFVLLAASAIASTTACGNIYLDYDIEFYIPQVESTPSGGYGYNLIGAGGSFSQSSYFGAAPTAKSWNNLPVSYASNVFTVPAGCYLAAGWITGTVLAPTVATTGTGLDAYLDTNSAGTRSTWMKTWYSTGTTSLTFAGTATSVTGSGIYISLLPSNAVSLTMRKLCQVTRLLKAIGDVDSIRESLETSTKFQSDPRSEGKESKEPVTLVRTNTVQSASASGQFSGTAASYRGSSPDERYVLVSTGQRI